MKRFEIEYGKDASCFTSLEIKDAFKQLNFVSVYMAANFRSQLSNYTQWCINRNMVADYQNHYLEITNFTDYVHHIKARRKIIARDEFIDAISNLNNVCDMYALLAIFEGVNGKNRSEILNLHVSDINRDNNIVTLHGINKVRTLKVSDKLIEWAIESADTFTYTALSGRQLQFAQDEDKDLVFKNFGNAQESSDDFYKGRRLYFRLDKSLDVLGLDDLSLNSIMDSGKIHMINMIAKQNNITGVDVLNNSELIQPVSKQYDVDMAIKRSIFIKNYEEYLV